ncbi:MAG: hypothetical protein A2Z29_03440 [Chloroflexi bacterium RBG_16_56_11]|nr:MAG: hypothetical protein A2Z29_03440 [Chloroflexi bacterium RBG_16_56_11]
MVYQTVERLFYILEPLVLFWIVWVWISWFHLLFSPIYAGSRNSLYSCFAGIYARFGKAMLGGQELYQLSYSRSGSTILS